MGNEQTVAEFFAGIGLMRLGLEHAGWHVVWANDIDEDKRAMYAGNFPDAADHFHLGDVHALGPGDVPTVDLATASFPCNDLSLAGARRGLAGQHSSAFWGFAKALKNMSRRPPLVLLENVAGFLSSNNGDDFRDVCLALNELGYAVDAFIIDALLFVPQSRQRMFIVGKQEKRKIGRVAEKTPSFYQSQLRPASLADFILWHPEINWSIRSLPPIRKRVMSISDIIEDIPANSTYWWSTQRAEYLLNQMSKKHRAIADAMISGKTLTYGTVFRRVRHGRSMAELRTDGIAGCLRTPRGGSGRQILFVAGKGRYAVRLLTPRECARLMGADDFKITGSLNKALFGFGDAVCVPVIEWIGKHYLNPVWEELYATEGQKEHQRATA
ncbi:MAG: DNA (cytosine-5-)-methyltransferase [Verrucomicrobiae bacterium]|nr:DNA (cytosine-5-)-methyltransferase [Verrucomicrobiae bacterium]